MFPGGNYCKGCPRSYIVKNIKGNLIRRNIRHLKNVNHVPENFVNYANSEHHMKEGPIEETA